MKKAEFSVPKKRYVKKNNQIPNSKHRNLVPYDPITDKLTHTLGKDDFIPLSYGTISKAKYASVFSEEHATIKTNGSDVLARIENSVKAPAVDNYKSHFSYNVVAHNEHIWNESAALFTPQHVIIIFFETNEEFYIYKTLFIIFSYCLYLDYSQENDDVFYQHVPFPGFSLDYAATLMPSNTKTFDHADYGIQDNAVYSNNYKTIDSFINYKRAAPNAVGCVGFWNLFSRKVFGPDALKSCNPSSRYTNIEAWLMTTNVVLSSCYRSSKYIPVLMLPGSVSCIIEPTKRILTNEAVSHAILTKRIYDPDTGVFHHMSQNKFTVYPSHIGKLIHDKIGSFLHYLTGNRISYVFYSKRIAADDTQLSSIHTSGPLAFVSRMSEKLVGEHGYCSDYDFDKLAESVDANVGNIIYQLASQRPVSYKGTELVFVFDVFGKNFSLSYGSDPIFGVPEFTIIEPSGNEFADQSNAVDMYPRCEDPSKCCDNNETARLQVELQSLSDKFRDTSADLVAAKREVLVLKDTLASNLKEFKDYREQSLSEDKKRYPIDMVQSDHYHRACIESANFQSEKIRQLENQFDHSVLIDRDGVVVDITYVDKLHTVINDFSAKLKSKDAMTRQIRDLAPKHTDGTPVSNDEYQTLLRDYYGLKKTIHADPTSKSSGNKKIPTTSFLTSLFQAAPEQSEDEKTIAELKKEMNKSTENVRKLEKMCDTHQQRIINMENEAAQLKKTNSGLFKQHDDDKKQLRSELADVTKLKNTANATILISDSHIDNLKKELLTINGKLSQCVAESSKKDITITKLSEPCKDCLIHVTKLGASHLALKSVTEQLNVQIVSNKNAEGVINQKTELIKKSNEENVSLSKQLVAMTDDLKASENTNVEITKRINALIEENITIKAKPCDDCQIQKKTIADQTTTINQLNTSLSTSNLEKVELHKKLDASDLVIKERDEKIESLLTTIASSIVTEPEDDPTEDLDLTSATTDLVKDPIAPVVATPLVDPEPDFLASIDLSEPELPLEKQEKTPMLPPKPIVVLESRSNPNDFPKKDGTESEEEEDFEPEEEDILLPPLAQDIKFRSKNAGDEDVAVCQLKKLYNVNHNYSTLVKNYCNVSVGRFSESRRSIEFNQGLVAPKYNGLDFFSVVRTPGFSCSSNDFCFSDYISVSDNIERIVAMANYVCQQSPSFADYLCSEPIDHEVDLVSVVASIVKNYYIKNRNPTEDDNLVPYKNGDNIEWDTYKSLRFRRNMVSVAPSISEHLLAYHKAIIAIPFLPSTLVPTLPDEFSFPPTEKELVSDQTFLSGLKSKLDALCAKYPTDMFDAFINCYPVMDDLLDALFVDIDFPKSIENYEVRDDSAVLSFGTSFAIPVPFLNHYLISRPNVYKKLRFLASRYNKYFCHNGRNSDINLFSIKLCGYLFRGALADVDFSTAILMNKIKIRVLNVPYLTFELLPIIFDVFYGVYFRAFTPDEVNMYIDLCKKNINAQILPMIFVDSSFFISLSTLTQTIFLSQELKTNDELGLYFAYTSIMKITTTILQPYFIELGQIQQYLSLLPAKQMSLPHIPHMELPKPSNYNQPPSKESSLSKASSVPQSLRKPLGLKNRPYVAKSDQNEKKESE